MWGTSPPCPTVSWPLWGIWSGQICLLTSKDSFWVLVVWCEELVHHVPLLVDLYEDNDQARYVYLSLRTVSGSWWCGVRNWSTMSHCLLTSVRKMIRPDMYTYLWGQFLGPDVVAWGFGQPCPTVCWPLWGIWSGQICLLTSKDSFWVLTVWCEELIPHVPLFTDLCEEYDQANYAYLPLRTVSGSWWCGVRNWSTMSHCL